MYGTYGALATPTSKIMRGVDLNMTLAGPGSSIGLSRVGRVRGWGEWVLLSMARRTVIRSLRRSPSRLGPGDRSVAPPSDGVATARLDRGHHGGHSGVAHGSSCSRTRGHAGWSGFSSGKRADPIVCFRCWVVLVRVAGGMVVSAKQPGGDVGSLPWFACPRWRVATYFGAWSRFWRPRVDRPGPRRDGGHRGDRVHGPACHQLAR